MDQLLGRTEREIERGALGGGHVESESLVLGLSRRWANEDTLSTVQSRAAFGIECGGFWTYDEPRQVDDSFQKFDRQHILQASQPLSSSPPTVMLVQRRQANTGS